MGTVQLFVEHLEYQTEIMLNMAKIQFKPTNIGSGMISFYKMNYESITIC